MTKKLLAVVFFTTIFNFGFAQQKAPMMAMPRNAANNSNYRIGCSLFTDPNNYTNGSSFSFNAPVNNNSNLTGTGGANYGCMGSVPNQAWFIITVNTGGNLYFNYSNSNGYDVDAVVWGPLANNDVANACNATLNYPLTCDYDAARPDLYINNAQAGQKYVMLVTNYSNANTVINISQPSGGNVTYSMVNLPNCSLTPTASISGTSTTITEGQSATLSLSFTGSSPWNYTLSDGSTGTTYTSPVNVTVYPTASQTYTISSVNNLCGTSGGSGSVGVSVVRSVQLKSCFPLDGNATDSQAINSGSLQNGVTPTTNRLSEPNKALQFDGIDDYVNIPTNQLNNTTFGFATWVKLNALPTLGNPEQLALSLGSTGEQHYIGVEYANGSPTWKLYSNGITVYSNAIVNTDWHLLVGVRTGGQLKLYVDGNLTGISNTNGTAFYDGPLFGRIGSGIANNKFFNGKIDDVKIFNGALIDPEVMLLQNYNSCNNVFNDTYISVQSVSTAVICTGTSFIVRAFTNNLPIENDLQFVAELSDANGTFNNPTVIGFNQFLPLTVNIPSNVQGGNYKIRVRYGGYVSVNTFDIFVNNPSTYSVSGTVALNDGQSTNINLNFTGTGPWNYVLTNGLSGVATTNPWQITVTPDQSTVYAISTASNVCGTTTLNGNSSAIVTVNFTKQFVTCLPFTNNSNDANGNNTATVNGPILTDDRYGQTNGAYNFNGNGNYIQYTTNLLRKREYTMSAWVLANSIPSGTQYIISQGETSTNTFQGLAMTSSGWVMQSYTSNGVYSVSSSTGFAANQWIHLTAVCSYQSLRLYVNGNLVSTAFNSSFIPFKISDIGRIGANSSSLGNYFNGKIDDVRLYKGALNDDEVFALFSNTNNCPVVENASLIVVRSLSPATVCAGNNVSVAYTSSNVNISAGSPLNVLLSDQNGSFANATIIGSGSSTPITATIPANINASNFYRIRLISTSGTPVNSINSSTLAVSGSRPTATVSGGGSIQNGQSANIIITFTGSAPWTYALNNGASQSTSTSPLVLPVSPFSTTTYTVTSVGNSCGSGTSSGSATVTVAPFIGLGSLNSAYCTGTNFSVPFQANFTPNNNFRVELSDAVGNFNSPISIGTGTISPITAQIPNNITSGTGYKIRIVSDSPAAISVASSALTINQKATASVAGTTTISEGQSTNLTINFTGQGPWTYAVNNGSSQTTSNNTVVLSVSPIVTTTYTITSISNNSCGAGITSVGATVTVNQIPLRQTACFALNGNALDSKRNISGTMYGPLPTTDRFGNPTGALNFDGVDDYIDIPVNGTLFSNHSFSVWFKFDNSKPFGYLFATASNDWNMMPQTTLYLTGTNVSVFHYSHSPDYFSSGSYSIPYNQWNHAIVTRDGQNVKVYVNGVLRNSVTSMTNAGFPIDSKAILGQSLNGGNQFFKGQMDDFQIYKGALTDAQVAYLYNSQLNCDDPSLIPSVSLNSVSSPTFCTNQNLSLTFTSTNITPNAQNPILAELSDIYGLFTNPTTIGTTTSISGNLSLQLPANQATGNTYKIRLKYANLISETFNISISTPITATISGTNTVNEGQATNLTINFTGSAPYSYSINGGASQSTSNNPLTITVYPITNTTYTITSLSNGCGNVTGSGSAIITVTPVAVRLVSCFSLENGNGSDLKGLNSATFNNTSGTTDRFNNVIGASYFNGGSYSETYPVNSLTNPEFTYSAWFLLSNPMSSGAIYPIIDIGSQRISINNIGGSYVLSYIGDNGFNNRNSSLPVLSANQWYHVVFSRYSGLYSVYLNGNQIDIGTVSFNSASYLADAKLTIGKFYIYNFIGKIDDVQIYKGALTAGQVRALYQNQNSCFDATTYTCLSNMAYNSILNGQQTLQVSNQIIGSSTIQTGSNIHFDSKNSVILQPGFKTEANTVFRASAGGGCN